MSTTTTTFPRLRALCCQCGQLRTVSAGYRRRDGNDVREDPAFRHPERWRMTITLKCAHCGEPTRHALLRDKGCDFAEDEDYKQARQVGR